jgi:glycosyltransferase involved in cell wall biosynthesis
MEANDLVSSASFGVPSHLNSPSRQELERVCKTLESELAGLRAQLLDGKQAQALARTEKNRLGGELKQTQQRVKTLLQDNVDLGAKNTALQSQLDEIGGSFAWTLVKQMRTIQATLLPDGTVRRRYWYLVCRFIKTAITSGVNVAVGKAFDKVGRTLNKRLGKKRGRSTAFLSRVFPLDSASARFRELPWRFLGNRARGSSRICGYFKLLLVSHSACRTGAPLCLLRLAEELSRLPDFECWIVLLQGGELEDSFARVAPTLNVERLAEQGIAPRDIPDWIASSFHDFSSRGVAVCNTLAANPLHRALAERKVAVLSWIHELPTFIEALGGVSAIERIKSASRKIVVPAEVVRGALMSKFAIDPDCISTVYYGQDPRTRGMDRETMRLQIRQELGLPADARIVLGCGSVDLRKGADLFVNLARRFLNDPLAENLATRTWFIWVGHCNDRGVLGWLLHDAGIGELDDRICFIGPRENTAPYFLAADVFALTSREDACPLVNFEAMESGLAVVAFLEAGGAPEVLGGGGISVPYLDVDAMSRAVLALLADPVERDKMGRCGQNLVRTRFTWSRSMSEILDILKTDFQYQPARSLKVSVIVPNYRHERYLEDRLRSIFRQTVKPHEIIFLDDASPDKSVKVARRVAAEAPVPMQILVNEQNSGSTFRQWMKGLSLASGDLVWLAESDDSCHPEFLERLVPEFYDPDVALAYCQSALIGPRSERWSDNFLGHTDDISESRWRSRYSVPGVVEAAEALSQKNTIPNASAVVFRRPPSLDFAEDLEKLRFAGDWLFYSLLIRSGKIVYIPEVLNEYRRHEQTVTHQSIREETHAQETLQVKARIFETFNVHANEIAQSMGRSVLEYNQLSERANLRRPTFTANPHLAPVLLRIRSIMQNGRGSDDALKILLVVRDAISGAESLANIHLANALARENLVFLCNAQPTKFDVNLVQHLDDRVILLEGTLGETPWSPEIEGLAEGRRVHSGRRVQILEELTRFHRIDVIHSRSWPADRLVLGLNRELKLPWFIHFDGCDHPLIHREGPDPGSARVAADLFRSARGIFYTHQCENDLLDQPTDLSQSLDPRLDRFRSTDHDSSRTSVDSTPK